MSFENWKFSNDRDNNQYRFVAQVSSKNKL